MFFVKTANAVFVGKSKGMFNNLRDKYEQFDRRTFFKVVNGVDGFNKDAAFLINRGSDAAHIFGQGRYTPHGFILFTYLRRDLEAKNIFYAIEQASKVFTSEFKDNLENLYILYEPCESGMPLLDDYSIICFIKTTTAKIL